MIVAAAVPPAVVEVAQRFVQTSRGIVGFRMHRTFDVHAGPQTRHDDLVMDGVSRDGALVWVHIVSETIGGQAQSTQQMAQDESGWLHPKPGDSFRPPFDPRYVNEYRYAATAINRVTFTAIVRDSAHGDGTFAYDGAHDVLSYTYSPNVLPSHATTGTVSDRRARVLPGYWALVAETQQYGGRYALWSGGATVQIRWTDFRRYSTLQQATGGAQHSR